MFRNNDVSDGGRSILITPPTDEALPLDVVKRHLRVLAGDEDDAIKDIVADVAATLDPASAGWLGRALRPQTWELQLRSFNDRRLTVAPHSNPLAIPLPFPPLISVASVKYLDVNGVDTTLVAGTDYRILGLGHVFERQAIAPAYSKSWPVARPDDASVRIRYQCGYAAADAEADPAIADALPLPIRRWMLLVIGSLYENRESFIASNREQIAELPPHVLSMIESFRLS